MTSTAIDDHSPRERAWTVGLLPALWLTLWAVPALAHFQIGSTFGLCPPDVRDLAGAVVATALPLAITLLLPSRRIRAAWCALGAVLLMFVGVLEIGSLAHAGGDWNRALAQVVLHASSVEVSEFLSGRAASPILLEHTRFFVVPVGLLVACLLVPGALARRRFLVLAAIAGIVAAGASLAAASDAARACEPSAPRWTRVLPLTSYDPLRSLYETIVAAASTPRTAQANHLVSGIERVGTPPSVLVVVIGESLSRHHMGLYGYGRPTTPRLSAMADAGRLAVYTDAAASQTATRPSLLDALSLGGDGSARPGATIFDALAPVFDTVWITNQARFPIFRPFLNTDEDLLSDGAGARVWLNTQPSRDVFDDALYDGRVLDAMADALRRPIAGRPRALFVHLMGSHYAYDRRFPPSFRRFTGSVPGQPPERARAINDYDNSILYNDFVVSTVIERIDAMQTDAAVIYVADHGDEVYDFRDFVGHSPLAPSRVTADVPWIVWLSDTYRKTRPALAQRIAGAIDTPTGLNDLAPAILDLAALRTPAVSLSRVPWSADYHAGARLVSGRPYDSLPGSPGGAAPSTGP